MKEKAVYLIIILVTVLVLSSFTDSKFHEHFTGINSELVSKYNSSRFIAGCSMVETDEALKQKCCEKGFCDESTTMFKEGNELDDKQTKALKLCPALAEGIAANLGMVDTQTVEQICMERKENPECHDAGLAVPELQALYTFACDGKAPKPPKDDWQRPPKDDWQRPPKDDWQRPPKDDWQRPPKDDWQRPPKDDWQRPPKDDWQRPPRDDWQRPPKDDWQRPPKDDWQRPPKDDWQRPPRDDWRRPGCPQEDERTQPPGTYPGRTGGRYSGNPGGWSGCAETRCKESGQPSSCSTYAPYGEAAGGGGVSKCAYCNDIGCSKCQGNGSAAPAGTNNGKSRKAHSEPKDEKAYSEPTGEKAYSEPASYENYQNHHVSSEYILKSEIVPPVCPACPPCPAMSGKGKCQPCPPCARCPEPSFECKKVPNYNSGNLHAIPGIGPWGGAGAGDPMPRLNSFSGFS